MGLDVLTAAEVAKLIRVSRDTVYALAARGELPGRKVGRIWRFPRDAVESYIRPRPAEGTATYTASGASLEGTARGPTR